MGYNYFVCISQAHITYRYRQNNRSNILSKNLAWDQTLLIQQHQGLSFESCGNMHGNRCADRLKIPGMVSETESIHFIFAKNECGWRLGRVKREKKRELVENIE